MKYYTCYETRRMKYAEEAQADGYLNEKVLNEEELLSEGEFTTL